MATSRIQVDIVIENEKAIAAFCKGVDCVRRAAESYPRSKDLKDALQYFRWAMKGLVPKAKHGVGNE